MVEFCANGNQQKSFPLAKKIRSPRLGRQEEAITKPWFRLRCIYIQEGITHNRNWSQTCGWSQSAETVMASAGKSPALHRTKKSAVCRVVYIYIVSISIYIYTHIYIYVYKREITSFTAQSLKKREPCLIVSSAKGLNLQFLPARRLLEICHLSERQEGKESPRHLESPRTRPVGLQPVSGSRRPCKNGLLLSVYPRCSMYGIFTYIWAIFGVNVGKYSSTMEHMGTQTSKGLSSRLPK